MRTLICREDLTAWDWDDEDSLDEAWDEAMHHMRVVHRIREREEAEDTLTDELGNGVRADRAG